jgi:site-specific DNA recombinase
MTHTMTKHRANPAVRYRYYRCTNAIKNGASERPAGTIPAAEIEQMVVDELRGLGSDPELLGRVLAAAHAAIDVERAALEQEQANLQRSC